MANKSMITSTRVLRQRQNPLDSVRRGLGGFFTTLSRNRAGMIGFIGLLFFFILTFIGPIFVPFDDVVKLDQIAAGAGSRIQLIVRQENTDTYTDFESLAGKRVGVIESTGGPNMIAPYADTLEVETFAWNSRRAGPGIIAGLTALDAGEVDALLLFSKSVSDYVTIPEAPDLLQVLTDPLRLFSLTDITRLRPDAVRDMAQGIALLAEDTAALDEAQRGELHPESLMQVSADLLTLADELEARSRDELAESTLADLTALDADAMAQIANQLAALSPATLAQIRPETYTALALESLAQRVSFKDLVVSNPTLGPPHLLGTDTQGRDIASHIVNGGSVLITVALLAGTFSTTIAVVLGSLAALFTGPVDQVLTAFTNLILAIPRFPLLIVLAGIFNQTKLIDLNNPLWLAVLIGALAWPSLMRSVRAQVLSLRERDYVEAAVGLDLGTGHVMFREILPNMISYIAIHLIFSITFSMYEQIGLVFLGFASINNHTWGVMIAFGRQRGTIFNPEGASMLVSPILAIALFQVFMIMFARAMEEIFDPRLRAAS